MAVDMDGCQSGLLSLFAKEMSFIKTTTGSNPVPSSIRYLYTAVKGLSYHGCLTVYTTQQMHISLQVKQLLQRVDGEFNTDHMYWCCILR